MSYSAGQIAAGMGILLVILAAAWYAHYKFMFRSCTADADCKSSWMYPGAWFCNGGKCKPITPVGMICNTDADCPSGKKCVGGACA